MLEVETIVVPADAVVGRRLSEQEKKNVHIYIYISVHRRRERLTVVDGVRKVFTGYVTLGFIIG